MAVLDLLYEPQLEDGSLELLKTSVSDTYSLLGTLGEKAENRKKPCFC